MFQILILLTTYTSSFPLISWLPYTLQINTGFIAEAEVLLDRVIATAPRDLGARVARGTARAMRKDLSGVSGSRRNMGQGEGQGQQMLHLMCPAPSVSRTRALGGVNKLRV